MPEIAVLGVIVVETHDVDSGRGPALHLGIRRKRMVAERQMPPLSVGLLDDARKAEVIAEDVIAFAHTDRIGHSQRLAGDLDPIGGAARLVASHSGSAGGSALPGPEVRGGQEIEALHPAVEQHHVKRRMVLGDQDAVCFAGFAENGRRLLVRVGIVGGADAQPVFAEVGTHRPRADPDRGGLQVSRHAEFMIRSDHESGKRPGGFERNRTGLATRRAHPAGEDQRGYLAVARRFDLGRGRVRVAPLVDVRTERRHDQVLAGAVREDDAIEHASVAQVEGDFPIRARDRDAIAGDRIDLNRAAARRLDIWRCRGKKAHKKKGQTKRGLRHATQCTSFCAPPA